MIKKNPEIAIAIALSSIGLIILLVLVLPAYTESSSLAEQINEEYSKLEIALGQPVGIIDIQKISARKKYLESELEKIKKFYIERDRNIKRFFTEEEGLFQDKFPSSYNEEIHKLNEQLSSMFESGVPSYIENLKRNELQIQDKDKLIRFWTRKKIFGSIAANKIKLKQIVADWWPGDSATAPLLTNATDENKNGEITVPRSFDELPFITTTSYLVNLKASPQDLFKILVSVPNPQQLPDILIELAGIWAVQSTDPSKANLTKSLFKPLHLLEDQRQNWKEIKQSEKNKLTPDLIEAVLVFRILLVDTEAMEKFFTEKQSGKGAVKSPSKPNKP